MAAALQSAQAGHLMLYSLLSVALLHTHYFAAWLLLAHEIVYWRCSRTRPWAWIASRCAVGAAFLPWVWWAAQHINLGSAEWIRSSVYYAPLALLRYLIGYGIAAPNQIRLTQPWGVVLQEEGLAVALAAGPLLILLAVGVRRVAIPRKGAEQAPPVQSGSELPDSRALRALFGAVLVVPVAGLLALSPWRSLLHDRNLAWQAPFVLLLIAVGLASLRGRARIVAGLACAGAMAFALYAYSASPLQGRRAALGYALRYGKEDWRAAAEYVRETQPDAVILAPAYIGIAFDRYWNAATAKAGAPHKPVGFRYGAVDSGGVPYVGNAQRVVLVLSHAGPVEEGLIGGLGRNHRLSEARLFLHQSGIRVFVYDAASR
jgi:hypothetical protein